MDNGERLKRLRHKLNLSVNEMAYLLGLSGANAGDKVREIERGGRDMSGSLLNVMRYIELGAFSDLDAFSMCKGASGFYVTHNHWPRFVLKPASKRESNAQSVINGCELVMIDSNTAALLCWIDEPLNDHKEATQSAIDLLKGAYDGGTD